MFYTDTPGILLRRSIHRAGLLALLCLSLSPATAAEPATDPLGLRSDPRGSEIQLFIENDSFGSSDRYYTNGFKIGGGVPADRVLGLFSRPPNALLDAISDGSSNHFGLFLGQNLYTPRDITIAAPQPNDRPWAAWLYLGAVAQRVKDDRLHTVEFDLGVVGRPALGKPIQTFWHNHVVDSADPRGWDNQIRSEPGFLLTYLHKRRYGERSGIQLVPHIGATLGTIMTLARAGGIVRIGQNMTGFGPDGIEPGGAMLKNARDEQAGGRAPYEWFVFGGFDYRAVGHNIFLDGSLFRDGPGVQRHDTVHDILTGVSVRLDTLRLSVTRVLRSEEFTAASGGGGKQRFYSVNLGVEF